jgi:uncharacterized repeat protein (TIGR01451 family)
MVEVDKNMKKSFYKYLFYLLIFSAIMIIFTVLESEKVNAAPYDGEDLAMAILTDNSTYYDSEYNERLQGQTEQSCILTNLGTMNPTHGDTFILLSTGKAGVSIITTDEENPGDERGTYLKDKYGMPRDFVELILELTVPMHMHSLIYDYQFFSTEFPEYVTSQYNDIFTVTVNSPSEGISTYSLDVSNGNFILDSNYINGTGFDIFAQSGNPNNIDIVDTTPRNPGADAGATALTTIGGTQHPVSPLEVSPLETITVTFRIEDSGDNQLDSAIFIDNLAFSGYAKTEIIARKNVEDINGGLPEPGDILEYKVMITNIGAIPQPNNSEDEFIDILPENTTYVNNSATSINGTINYNNAENKITWNGEIPKETTIDLYFKVKADSDLQNGTIISNQGTVYWDSNENGINDATELTDYPESDDGIDTDGDNKTDDDDPTIITIIAFDAPYLVIEDFSDDTPGNNATQKYQTQTWFETNNAYFQSEFEVSQVYYYSTSKSYKTQIRQLESPLYWNYTLATLNRDINYWESWFTCGNFSEKYDLYLTFINTNEEEILKLKFEYFDEGTETATSYILKLFYYKPEAGWIQLQSDYSGGYLYNYNWYKIKIERYETNKIKYTLFQNTEDHIVYESIDNQPNPPFSNLKQVKWSSSYNPIICPMFFWDEHQLGLI